MVRSTFFILVSILFVRPVFAVEWIANPANGHQYAIIPADTWDSGESQALSLGGHLVSINDFNENDWVLHNVLDPTQEAFAWIGFHQLPNFLEPAGGWVWASGEPVTYTNWSGGEPNNLEGGEDWAEMYSDFYAAPGHWNDVTPYISTESPHWAIVEVIPEPSCLVFFSFGSIVLLQNCKRRLQF